jgi:hypothetical protein
MRNHTKSELLESRVRKGESTIGVDHKGQRTPDHPGPALARSHSQDGERGHITRQDAPNIARSTSVGKQAHDVKIAYGMLSQTRTGPLAYGGDHASALDSLSGKMVVPYKDGSVAAEHPLTAAPIAKAHIGRPVAIHPSMRSRNDDALASENAGVAHNRHAAKREAIQAAHDALGHAVISDALAARRWDK